jgi:hypothetical protein
MKFYFIFYYKKIKKKRKKEEYIKGFCPQNKLEQDTKKYSSFAHSNSSQIQSFWAEDKLCGFLSKSLLINNYISSKQGNSNNFFILNLNPFK